MYLTKSLRIPCSTENNLCQVPSGAGITYTLIKTMCHEKILFPC